MSDKEEDIPTTQNIEKSCKILGISFLDHVIVGKHRHFLLNNC